MPVPPGSGCSPTIVVLVAPPRDRCDHGPVKSIAVVAVTTRVIVVNEVVKNTAAITVSVGHGAKHHAGIAGGDASSVVFGVEVAWDVAELALSSDRIVPNDHHRVPVEPLVAIVRVVRIVRVLLNRWGRRGRVIIRPAARGRDHGSDNDNFKKPFHFNALQRPHIYIMNI